MSEPIARAVAALSRQAGVALIHPRVCLPRSAVASFTRAFRLLRVFVWMLRQHAASFAGPTAAVIARHSSENARTKKRRQPSIKQHQHDSDNPPDDAHLPPCTLHAVLLFKKAFVESAACVLSVKAAHFNSSPAHAAHRFILHVPHFEKWLRAFVSKN